MGYWEVVCMLGKLPIEPQTQPSPTSEHSCGLTHTWTDMLPPQSPLLCSKELSVAPTPHTQLSFHTPSICSPICSWQNIGHHKCPRYIPCTPMSHSPDLISIPQIRYRFPLSSLIFSTLLMSSFSLAASVLSCVEVCLGIPASS